MLLASALYPLQAAEVDHLRNSCRFIDDWESFIALVRRHGLAPTIYLNLLRHAPDRIPQPVLAFLKEQADLNRQRSLQILAELGRISQWFAQGEIPLCVLKGPILAQRLFGNSALRSSGDLDILIPSTSLQQADTLLLAHGCQRVLPDVALDSNQWRAFQRQWYNSTYLLPESRINIELHWSVASPDLVTPEAISQMFSRIQPLAHSVGLYTLADEDIPVYLVVHGSKHKWVRLKWLVDFVAWLRSAEPREISDLQRKMEYLELERLLGQGLWLAKSLFGTSFPEAEQATRINDTAIRRLAEWSLKAILDPGYTGPETETKKKIQSVFYRMQLKKGMRYKLATLYRMIRPWLWMPRYYFRLHKDNLAAASPGAQ